MSTERRASLFQTLSSLTDAVLLCRVADRWSNLPASLLETKLGRVITSVSDYTLSAADCGAVFVSSKTSTLNLFLPPATVGLRYTVYLRSSYRVQVDPQAGESLTHPTTGALAAACVSNGWMWRAALVTLAASLLGGGVLLTPEIARHLSAG